MSSQVKPIWKLQRSMEDLLLAHLGCVCSPSSQWRGEGSGNMSSLASRVLFFWVSSLKSDFSLSIIFALLLNIICL